jgi:hypothetical protein
MNRYKNINKDRLDALSLALEIIFQLKKWGMAYNVPRLTEGRAY